VDKRLGSTGVEYPTSYERIPKNEQWNPSGDNNASFEVIPSRWEYVFDYSWASRIRERKRRTLDNSWSIRRLGRRVVF
jgi:hypothetical protein